MSLAPGTIVGQYRITALVGVGGMGEVYRARHILLGRDVALKTLLPGRHEDADLNRRFLLEAQAVSALQHPNIVTLYDTAEWNGMAYIAMEYVEGTTLAALLAQHALEIGQAVRYAIQIAHALGAAHRAGIVHRDIKPGNIMITRSNVVKVLDFGLAKRTDDRIPHPAAGDGENITRTFSQPLTSDNRMVGTAAYMSPEQAEGRPLDARSDVFSFGAVFYEMLTRKQAFEAESTLSTLTRILRDEPPQISAIAPEVPRDIAEIARLCLRKSPDERLQNMHDVACMLELYGGRGDAPKAVPPTGRRRPFAIVAAVLIAAAAGAGAAWWMRASRPTVTASRPNLRRITWDGGLDIDPALSSDGKMLAFSSDRAGGGTMDIYVRYVNGGDPVRLTRDPGDDTDPSFSPDGSSVAFYSSRDGGGIYVVPTIGGQERPIAPLGFRPRFSPDGKWLAYWTGERSNSLASGRIYIIPVTGGAPRQLATEFAGARYPVWTPDGTHILFEGVRAGRAPGALEAPDWWVTSLENGAAIKTGALDSIHREGLTVVDEPGGWREGKLVFSARDENTRSIYEIPISARTWTASGPPQPATFSAESAGMPQTGPDGRIVFANLRYEINVWSRRIDAPGNILAEEGVKLTTGSAYHSSVSLSSDENRMAFVLGRHPRANAGVKDMHSDRTASVTLDSTDKCSVALLADGSQVAWSVCGPGPESIHAASLSPTLSASPQHELCDDCGRVSDWSRTGKLIYFVDHAAPSRVGLLNVQSGNRTAIASSRCSLDEPRLSPDGAWLAVACKSAEKSGIYVIPVNHDQPAPESEWIQATKGQFWDEDPVWSPNGAALLFYSKRDGYGCIWRQVLDPRTKRPKGEPSVAADFHTRRFSMADMNSRLISLFTTRNMLTYTILESIGSIWILEPPRQ